jgi:hypothetical protein
LQPRVKIVRRRAKRLRTDSHTSPAANTVTKLSSALLHSKNESRSSSHRRLEVNRV